jgi:hypothetical protein
VKRTFGLESPGELAVFFCTALFYLRLKVSDPQISCNHSTSASRDMAVRKSGSTGGKFCIQTKRSRKLVFAMRGNHR